MKDPTYLETERALRESERKFLALARHTSDAYLLHDARGRLLDVNPEACRSLGYTREELLERNIFDIDADFNLPSAQTLWDLVPSGDALTLHARHRRKSGASFPVEARITACELDGQRHYMVLARNIDDRERADLALRQSEGQYRLLFNSIEEGFCLIEMIYDSQGAAVDYRFVDANPAFERQVGLRNCIGRTIREVAPNIEQKWIQTYARIAATGQPARFTEQSETLDRWFEVYALAVEGNHANQVGILFTDITERRRGEEALRQSQRQITEFANTIPTLAWMGNADGYLTWYNQSWYEYTGTTPGQMEGWGWQSVHDPALLPIVMEKWTACIRTGQPFEMEFPLRRADGVLRSFLTRVVPVRNTKGELVQWFGTNTDVEDLRSTQVDLLKAQERIRLAMKSTPLLLYTVDRDLRYTWMPGAHPGFHRVDPLGHRGEEFMEATFAHALREFKLSVLESGNAGRREFATERDGKPIFWDITAEPIRDEFGAISGLTIAALDITQRVSFDEALRKSEKLALVGRLAATIAHEIRNPLDSIGNVLYLLESEANPETVRELARTAHEELARVEHIVTHTLQFNRKSSSLTEERLSDLLESSITIYSGRLKQTGTQIHRQYHPADKIFCLSSELRQVFANLIGNALDATQFGGTLSLRTAVRPNRRTGETGVAVTIADNGSGMSRRTAQRLFEPFFTTKGLDGTGIGLWVSREILDRHDALVRVKSREAAPGNGTVFSLWFPRTFSVRPIPLPLPALPPAAASGPASSPSHSAPPFPSAPSPAL